MSRYLQGFFKPKNPKKYAGDPKNIVYRSSYELGLMKKLDESADIEKWASESFSIAYVHPDGKIHRYFPDVLWETVDGQKVLGEIKPYHETIPPVPGKNKKRYMQECLTYAINQAKWKAARYWCERRGIEFRILTEIELGIPLPGMKKLNAKR